MSRGIEILGISFDPVEANKAFAEKYQFPFRLLSDTSKAVGDAYGAVDEERSRWAKRISYLVGPDGKIVKAYPKVNVRQHAAEVLADWEAAKS